MERRLVEFSRFLSFVLRHRPESERLSIDEHGWVPIDELLSSRWARSHGINHPILKQIVAENDKNRFEFNDSETRIRARQGHSLPIQLDLRELTPPQRLFHGTASSALDSIRKQGLRRGKRHHVHLSPDDVTAKAVGSRHGRPVVLIVRAGQMRDRGYRFFASTNDVWLTDAVPPEFIDFPDSY